MANFGEYGTAILCMDGAYTGGVRKIMKKRHGVKNVDIIPQPGIVKILAEDTELTRLEIIMEMIEISVVNHRSRAIAIAAHHNCLGNPVSKDCQLRQLPMALASVRRIIKNLGLNHLEIQYNLLWINEKGLPEEVHIFPQGHILVRELITQPTVV